MFVTLAARVALGVDRQDMKIRNDLYLQCLDDNNISRKGYQRSYDEICDFLKDLDSLSIERDIGVLKDHVYRKYVWP